MFKNVEHTLGTRVQCTGIGLHTGKPVDVVLRPAAAGTGILFSRTDQGRQVRFPARAEWVVDTRLATTLGNDDVRLSTIEHLISALRGMGVDNCTVEVAGPELPIMDGSAAPWVYLIQQAGLRPLRRMRRSLVIRKPIEVRDGNRWVRVIPSREFKTTVSIDYPHPAIGQQSLQAMKITREVYSRAIAPARTFGFLRDVQQLQAAGLALGGSLQNAIVLDEARVLNADGLRFKDEFVRHKILDLVGDLALLGLPLQGHVKAMRSGHALHQALVAEIRANPSCWTVEVPGPATPEREAAPRGLSRPALVRS
ncbi:MAG: UDP-3-O-acyl-N-acetylglucosamine deacetylase [bacterium]|nr:UDP-3-O-acyl-N-acetylglucosamine deacetylase [bacterium]